MYVKRATVTVTTAADGTATAYSARLSGKLLGIAYAKIDFAAGVDFTITSENTGENLWVDTNVDASESVYPRRLVQDTAGANIAATYDNIYLGSDRVKIVIAAGGNVKTGTFHILMG